MSELEFFKNMQNLINYYMEDRSKKRSINWIKDGIKQLMDDFGIGFTDDKKMEDFLDIQMKTLEKIYKNIENGEHGEQMKNNIRTFLKRFKDFIL